MSKIFRVFLERTITLFVCMFMLQSHPHDFCSWLFQKLKAPLHFEKILMLVVWPCVVALGAFSKDILPVEISEGRLWQKKRNILNKLGQKEPIINSFKNYTWINVQNICLSARGGIKLLWWRDYEFRAMELGLPHLSVLVRIKF